MKTEVDEMGYKNTDDDHSETAMDQLADSVLGLSDAAIVGEVEEAGFDAHEEAVEILSARKPAGVNPEALVFATRTGTPFEPHNLSNRQLRPTCKRLGLVGVGWHWLRHANATLLDAVHTPLGTVQALLGHSSSEITREVYLHSIPADARAAVQKVEDLLIGPKWTQVSEIGKTGSSLIQ